MHRSVYLCLLLLAAPLLAADLNVVQRLLDSGNGEDALTLLEPHLRANPKDARAMLQRSTAYLLMGQLDQGRRDLKRALELDPRQRQAWLNQAGIDIAEQRWKDAIASLERARELDPNAADNDLNIGAVRVLSGDLTGATEDFRAYLSKAGADPEAYLLVATNYAVAGYAGPAVEVLRRAIAIDEKARRAVRADSRFASLGSNPGFAELLETDSYQPPAGSHQVTHRFKARYDGGRGILLKAVLDVLQRRGERFDPTVEVAQRWALVWSRVRIKVRDEGTDQGAIDISASPSAMSAAEFTQLSTALARDIEVHLVRLAPSK
jgi:tetratricopeptide (TPR) repeat protein